MTRVLLLSSSFTWGTGYLDHAEPELRDVLADVREVLFVPWAVSDLGAYAAKARSRFEAMGFRLRSVHEAPEPARAVEDARVVLKGVAGARLFRRGSLPVEARPVADVTAALGRSGKAA